jgi:hypothetical protein
MGVDAHGGEHLGAGSSYFDRPQALADSNPDGHDALHTDMGGALEASPEIAGQLGEVQVGMGIDEKHLGDPPLQ